MLRLTEDEYRAMQVKRALTVPDRRTGRGITDSRCDYLMTEGSLCNKCGRLHDGGMRSEFARAVSALPPADEQPASGPKFKSKAEAKYAQILESQRRSNLIRDWRYEGITLKLAEGVRYTPDFVVTENDGRMTLIEIKGFLREAARVRLKIAAEMYPAFAWFLVWAKRGKFDPQRLA